MSSISLVSLFTVETAATLLARGLSLASSLGLPTTSWRSGDPTLTAYYFIADVLASFEGVRGEFIRAGFLSTATGDWLTLYAAEVYGVEREEASFASGTLVLVNTAGGNHPIEANDLTFKSSVTGKTYHNTTGGTLAPGPGTTLTLSWEADEEGSASGVGTDEIGEIVAGPLAVEVQSSVAGTAIDAWSDEDLREQCTASLGALSPNGPADAYEYVARNSELTGVTGVTKAKTIPDEDTGDVTLYVAGPSGDVSGAIETAVANAIATWAAPLCITPAVESAVAVTVNFNLTAYLRSDAGVTESDAQDAIEAKLVAMVADLAIGGNDGYLHRSLISSEVMAAFPGYVYNTAITAPATDVALGDDEVAAMGTVTISVVFT